jgi:ATP-binding cassette, subfamily B, bacterial
VLDSRGKKFVSYYKPYLGWLAVDLVCTITVAVISLILPLCAGYITRNILGNPSADVLNQVYGMGALMFGLVIAYIACDTYIDYQGHMMGAVMERDMRRDLFDHYQKLSFRFYDEQKTGQLMTRLTNDLFSIGELYHHAPEDIVIAILKFVGVFVILGQINLQLTLIVFCFLPVMAVYGLYFNYKMRLAHSILNTRVGNINAQAEDTLAGIRVVQSFDNTSFEIRKFATENAHFVTSKREWYKNEAFFYQGVNALTQLMSIAVIVFGGVAIARAALTLDQLVIFLLCIGILSDPVQRLINFSRLYQEGIAGFDRFMEIMEIEPDIQDEKHAVERNDLRGEIEFRDVTFQYHSKSSKILKSFDLRIEAGEFVALVGTSGVGKTTLCSLISRFYEVTQGQICIDGHDIRNITLRSLRQQIGVVQQDVYLFAGTIADNIRYGKLEASDSDIVEAARKANAHDFIMALPHGYHTDVGQRGVKLSGGQKQRLSIARVFLKNPPIIIFDEATSALDNESEKAVQKSLEQLSNNRTTLVIAHRLSTVRNAHRILVLNDMGIAEQGTHEALIALGGIYANLHNTQLSI